MLRFIRRENVKHYRRLLEQTTDKAERQRVMRLLAEEEKKLRDAEKREITSYDDTH